MLQFGSTEQFDLIAHVGHIDVVALALALTHPIALAPASDPAPDRAPALMLTLLTLADSC